jgi:methyl-accepting chemotaxis protein
MKRLTFQQQLWIPLALSLVCLISVAGFGAYQTREVRLEERQHSLKDAGDIAMSITRRYAALAADGTLSTPEAKKQALAQLRAIRYGTDGYVSIVDSDCHSVMNPSKPQTEGKYFGDYQDSNGKYVYRAMAEIAKGSGDGFVDYATPRLGSTEPVRKRSHIATFKPWDWSFVTGAYLDDIDEAFNASLRQLLVLVAVIAAMLSGVVYLVNRRLNRSLGGSPEYAAQVVAATAGGNLAQHIDLQAGDRGSLLFKLQEMQAQLRQAVVAIIGAAHSIGTSTDEISSGNADLSRRTEEQAASLEETAASMEQLTSAVRQNADNARQASVLAGDAFSIANRGNEVVSEVVATMDEITDSTKQIGEILGMIEGIAFQTNILALNAAVEAARAGEHGRGFAVVASEVRNLAQRSSTASKDIKRLIDHSNDRVHNGAALVDNAGQCMKEILVSVQRVTAIMKEIASASEEQSDGIEQVNKAVTQMDEVTQRNAALVEQAAAAAVSMREQAHGLVESVAAFQVA